ncbi:DUF4279 domain-containing protein [Anaerovorax odorimutans]|uniref:DUF4279 domain-containing protein n=1 Tax=Anaerovorax odorimutans TaxID=109327 RepID=A0ABT1RRH7_9FIRM|nr:DUF4279 domain-containing protein [Anaerovorax odorimutans]MCQ4637782.1 DUF4279 domain-containing protein [Anaerovorax odorimutans]
MEKTTVRIDLRIMGDEYDPQKVTQKLNIQPTDTWRMGDYIRKTNLKFNYTGWLYSTGEEETLHINTQLRKIESLFLPKTDMLCELKERYLLDFSFDIVISICNHKIPVIYFESPFTQLVAKLDARIDFDIYVN